MDWNEIRTAFLASSMIPEEIRNEPAPQYLYQLLPENGPYPRLRDFMLGAEAMYKFLSSTLGDDLK